MNSITPPKALFEDNRPISLQPDNLAFAGLFGPKDSILDTVGRTPVVKLNNNFSVKSGEQLIVAATATDADNDTLSYVWTYAPLMASGSDTDTLTITAPNVTVNTDYSITLSVSDQGSTVTKTTVVTVLAETAGNEAPVVSPIADVNIDETMSVAINVSAPLVLLVSL